MSIAQDALAKRNRIRSLDMTIYDPIEGIEADDYFYTDEELLYLFTTEFKAASFKDLANKTRSKKAKILACVILGYSVPKAFKRTRPRFLNQDFDLIVQKALNFQPVNNDDIQNRRFVFAKINDVGTITAVRLIHGRKLLAYATTETLTLKHQARVGARTHEAELVSRLDTWGTVKTAKYKRVNTLENESPVANPTKESLLPIGEIYERLRNIVGQELKEIGRDQERNRGAGLHELALKALGYTVYADNGRHPDIPNQLLEIKLQTSPTIDLGSVDPTSEQELARVQLDGQPIRHCDVRFAIFVGKLESGTITIKHLVIVTGKDFFTTFTKFGGRGINSKRQIHLPKNFFD